MLALGDFLVSFCTHEFLVILATKPMRRVVTIMHIHTRVVSGIWAVRGSIGFQFFSSGRILVEDISRMCELGLTLRLAVRFACFVAVVALLSESLVEHRRGDLAGVAVVESVGFGA